MYLDCESRGQFSAICYNVQTNPTVIVLTDGGRVLGLGDLGAHAMGKMHA